MAEDAPSSDYADLLAEYARVFRVTDTAALDVTLATVTTARWDGDPLWAFLLGAPSSGKTEILRAFDDKSEAFKGMKMTYYLSSVTPRSLISGLKDGKDLLPELDGKTLIVKDFTTSLEMHREDRDALFAMLRDAFDGTFAKSFGTRGTVRYDSRFNLLAATTGAIEEYYTVQQVLGQRFLIVRMSFPEDFSADDVRSIERDRARLQVLASSVIRRTVNLPDKPPISSEHVRTCKAIAREVAMLRAHVPRDGYSHEISALPEPEAPARLTNQFIKLAKGLALVRAKSDVTEDEMESVVRVAYDSAPSVRRIVLKAIAGGELTIDGVAAGTGLSRRTVERKIEDLVVLKALTEDSSGKPYRYTLAKPFVLLHAIPPDGSVETFATPKPKTGPDYGELADHMRMRLRSKPDCPPVFLAHDAALAFQLSEDAEMLSKLEVIANSVRQEAQNGHISTDSSGEMP